MITARRRRANLKRRVVTVSSIVHPTTGVGLPEHGLRQLVVVVAFVVAVVVALVTTGVR
jgi:hypothetical protein